MMNLRRRPVLALLLTGVLLVIAGTAVYLASPDHDFGLVLGAPFNPLDLLSGQQKAGLAVGCAGMLALAFGAGTAWGMRLRATRPD